MRGWEPRTRIGSHPLVSFHGLWAVRFDPTRRARTYSPSALRSLPLAEFLEGLARPRARIGLAGRPSSGGSPAPCAAPVPPRQTPPSRRGTCRGSRGHSRGTNGPRLRLVPSRPRIDSQRLRDSSYRPRPNRTAATCRSSVCSVANVLLPQDLPPPIQAIGEAAQRLLPPPEVRAGQGMILLICKSIRMIFSEGPPRDPLGLLEERQRFLRTAQVPIHQPEVVQ